METPQGRCGEYNIIMHTHCNFACTYCYERPSRERLAHQMKTTTEGVDAFYARMKEHGYLENEVIDMIGGEGLLSLDLIEYIIQAGEKISPHFLYTIGSNGSLLCDDKVFGRFKTIVTGKNAKLYLSYDGPHGQGMRKYKTGEDSRDDVEKAILRVTEAGFIPVGIKMSIQPMNYDHFLYDVIYICEKFPKIESLQFNLIRLEGTELDFDALDDEKLDYLRTRYQQRGVSITTIKQPVHHDPKVGAEPILTLFPGPKGLDYTTRKDSGNFSFT